MPLRKVEPSNPQVDVINAYPGVDLDTLAQPFQQMFHALLKEVVSLRSAASLADLTLILTCCQSAEGKSDARAFAKQARVEMDAVLFQRFTKLAESQARIKQAALGRLGLAGDARGVRTAKLAASATSQTSVVGDGVKAPGRWK